MSRKRAFLCSVLSVLTALVAATPRNARALPPATKASAIQVIMIESNEIKLPAEFQIALYENLIEQLQKNGGFQHVYRQGDHNALGVADLVVLRSTVHGFKQGSEMARQVTTVAGRPPSTSTANSPTKMEN
jgi:hypothetical protein